MKRSARHDTRRRRNDEQHSRAVLALLSRMRSKGRVTLEELSTGGRLQLLEFDARERQRTEMQEQDKQNEPSTA